jgi:hypothetical protein
VARWRIGTASDQRVLFMRLANRFSWRSEKHAPRDWRNLSAVQRSMSDSRESALLRFEERVARKGDIW